MYSVLLVERCQASFGMNRKRFYRTWAIGRRYIVSLRTLKWEIQHNHVWRFIIYYYCEWGKDRRWTWVMQNNRMWQAVWYWWWTCPEGLVTSRWWRWNRPSLPSWSTAPKPWATPTVRSSTWTGKTHSLERECDSSSISVCGVSGRSWGCSRCPGPKRGWGRWSRCRSSCSFLGPSPRICR